MYGISDIKHIRIYMRMIALPYAPKNIRSVWKGDCMLCPIYHAVASLQLNIISLLHALSFVTAHKGGQDINVYISSRCDYFQLYVLFISKNSPIQSDSHASFEKKKTLARILKHVSSLKYS